MSRINGWRSTALLCVLAASTVLAAQPPDHALAVTHSKTAAFRVISNRLQPMGAAVAFGGLVGVAIETGIESAKDADMKKQLLAVNPELSCDQLVLTAFTDRIRADGTFAIDPANAKSDPTADIAIDECGLHLADTTANEFAAYIYLTLKFKPASGAAWSEKIQVSGRTRHTFDEFANEHGLAQSELEDVLKRAGMRAADKIIYKK